LKPEARFPGLWEVGAVFGRFRNSFGVDFDEFAEGLDNREWGDVNG